MTSSQFDPATGKSWMLEILCIATVTGVASEALMYIFVYRKDSYTSVIGNLEREQKKLDKLKDNEDERPSGKPGKTDKSKKIKAQETRVKELGSKLQVIRQYSNMALGFIMIMVFGGLSSMYDSKVVAKLPFVPFSMFQSITHRNVPLDDYTDCSFIFMYAISSMAIKANLQKALGFAPPPTPNGVLWPPGMQNPYELNYDE